MFILYDTVYIPAVDRFVRKQNLKLLSFKT